MKRLLFLILTISFSHCNVYSQWKSTDIQDSLKRNADAVIRRLVSDFKITEFGKIILTENVVITILNEEGKDFANFQEYYDKDSKIEYVKGTIYDDNGKVVKKIKRGEFKDMSLVPDYTLYADDRTISNEVFQLSYPFTVEYEYQKTDNNASFLPSWYPQDSYRLSLQNAKLKVSFPNSNLLRYKSFNITSPVKSVDENGQNIFQWEISNLKAVEKEYMSPKPYKFLPSVILGVTHFDFEGYAGKMDSWNSYGIWLDELQKDKNDISPVLQNKVKELVKDESNLRGKVRLIYKFMQSQTRYVGIQLGIGGFQPFAASVVEKNGYGDCKALVNYTRSLLSAVGIESFYCVIGTDNRGIIFDDFPGAGQTNHIILCVPNGVDTMWLECTNQHYPFAFVPHDYQNQKVLLVNASLSRLVNLPKAYAEKNVQTRISNIQIDSVGDAKGNMCSSELGAELENLFPEIWSNKKDQTEIIQRKYRIPGIAFLNFEYRLGEIFEPTASEKISFKIKGFASQTGKRFFIPVNPFAQVASVPGKVKKRITDIVVDECYTHIDTLTYIMPKGYSVESIPKPKSITGIFGSYNLSISIEGNKILTIRKYKQNRDKYPAKEYNNFVNFLSEVAKSDKQSIVLVLKQ